jgi:pyruvate/2-oxoglutarate/acetoin dehydrogenase E1 component
MSTKIRYSDAIVEALRMEMHRDPTIVLVGGPDTAAGLAAVFGDDRCIELPVSDEGRIAVAAGIAATGMRAVVEAPLPTLGPALIADLGHAITSATAESLPLPLVVRVPFGSGDAGADGARRALAALTALNDLSIVAPATPADAKGLLSTALHGSDPVCLLEHECLKRSIDGVPEGSHQVDIGSARVVRQGARLTIIASGPTTLLAEEAAQARPDDEVTILDLRTLRPLDRDSILDCVRGTGKVLVLEQRGCPAPADEVMGLIVGGAFEYLDGPIRRIELDAPATAGNGANAGPIERIEAACNELLAY